MSDQETTLGSEPAVATSLDAAPDKQHQNEFDLDSLMTFRFDPLKAVLASLLERQGALLEQVAGQQQAIQRLEAQARPATSTESQEDTAGSHSHVEERLAKLERLLGVGSEREADVRALLRSADSQDDRLASLERRVTVLEDKSQPSASASTGDGSSLRKELEELRRGVQESKQLAAKAAAASSGHASVTSEDAESAAATTGGGGGGELLNRLSKRTDENDRRLGALETRAQEAEEALQQLRDELGSMQTTADEPPASSGNSSSSKPSTDNDSEALTLARSNQHELQKLTAQVSTLRATASSMQGEDDEDSARPTERKEADDAGTGGGGGAARQAAMEQELERLRAAVKEAERLAEQALGEARDAKNAAMRQAAAAAAAAGGGGGNGQGDEGEEAQDTLRASQAVQAGAASTLASLSALAVLVRVAAGTNGVPQEQVEQQGDAADAAISDLETAVARVQGTPTTSSVEALVSATTASSAAIQSLLEEMLPLAQRKAAHGELTSLRRVVGTVESELGKVQASVRELRSRTEEQVAAALAGSAAAAAAASPTGSGRGGGGGGGLGGGGASEEEMAELWDALAHKADLEELHGMASLEALTAKADRRDLARVKTVLDKLWKQVRVMQETTKGIGDWASLSGRPLKDYRCLSCGNKLEAMVEPPHFHVSAAALPQPSLSPLRRSPLPGTPKTPQQATPGQSVVLPNGTVVRRPTPQQASTPSRSPMAAGDLTPLSAQGRRQVPRQSAAAASAASSPVSSPTAQLSNASSSSATRLPALA